jgi:hypothetical protein
MRGDMESVVAIFGDTHIGSTTGLCPPKFTIHNEAPGETQIVNHNSTQSCTWEFWENYWRYIDTLVYQGRKRKQKRLVCLFLADMIDGNHHGTRQIIQDVGDQMQVAIDVMQPIVDRADYFYAVNGTVAHAGSEEVAIYKHLGIEYAQTLMIEVDNKIHDIAHHGRVGGRTWTSQAASIATEVIVDCAISKVDLPNFIWRGHCHVIDDSGNKIEGTRAISVPSWQLKTSYAHGIPTVVNRRSDIGGYIVNGGILDESRSRYHGEADERRIIKL